MARGSTKQRQQQQPMMTTLVDFCEMHRLTHSLTHTYARARGEYTQSAALKIKKKQENGRTTTSWRIGPSGASPAGEMRLMHTITHSQWNIRTNSVWESPLRYMCTPNHVYLFYLILLLLLLLLFVVCTDMWCCLPCVYMPESGSLGVFYRPKFFARTF